MEKFIGDNRQATISIVSIFLMAVILFLGGTNIYSRISSVRSKINVAQGELNTLNNKMQVLSDAQINSISILANQASTTLPTNNPTLPLVINVRRINENVTDFVVENMEVGTQNSSSKTSSYNSAVLKISATSTVAGLDSFINQVARLNPVTNIKSLNVSRKFGSPTVDVEMELISFWSSLPTQLSNVSQTIAGLTSKEEQVLGQVSGFSQPAYSPSSNVEFTPRANPFVFEE